MTAVLRIRVDKSLDGGVGVAPEVPARISRIDSQGKSGITRFIREELIPISANPGKAARVRVTPGRYYVETTLPSGEVLAENATVSANATHDVVLRGRSSPNEWFSWQHLMGNTQWAPASGPVQSQSSTSGGKQGRPPTKSEVLAALSNETGLSRKQVISVFDSLESSIQKSLRSRGVFTMPGLFKMKVVGKPSVKAREGINPFTMEKITFKAKPASKNVRVQPLKSLTTFVEKGGASDPKHLSESASAWPAVRTPITLLTVADRPSEHADPWKQLADLRVSKAQALIDALKGREGSRQTVKASFSDRRRAIFRISSEDDDELGAVGRPTFAAVPANNALELLKLPVPWHIKSDTDEAALEIAVQDVSDSQRFRASLAVHDPYLITLLGFLSSGSLPLALEMTHRARDLLFRKFANPFAAAAGGYALVATVQRANKEIWQNWVRNLMRRFEDIPDGAIQWATLRLKVKRTKQDVEEARDALKTAYRRGLPFYSMGVRWLLEGLEWVGDQDPEARSMAVNVHRIARLVNYQQPFTTLRLPLKSDV